MVPMTGISICPPTSRIQESRTYMQADVLSSQPVAPLPFNSPYAALQWYAAQWPGRDGLVFPQAEERLSFSAWLDQCTRLAAGLQRMGVTAGDAVAIWAENRVEWAVSQLAIAALGAIMVPVNTHFREQDVSYVLNHSCAVAVMLSRRFRSSEYLAMVRSQMAQLPALRHVICFDATDEADQDGAVSYADLLLTDAAGFTPQSPAPRAIASIQYTSGTTGRPKGAALCFEGMMMNASGTAQRLHVTGADRWTSIIPLFHCAGCIMNIMTCLSAGAAYVGLPAFDAEQMMRIIEGEKCTLLTGVPTSYIAMLEHPRRKEYDLSSLRAGTCGGADCDPEVLARCAEEFPIPGLVQVYGQTESSTLIALDDIDSPQRWRTAGLPLDGMQVRVTDPNTHAVVREGIVGQIEVRGPMVMLGYFGQRDETAKTIDAEGWMQSGDLGYLQDDGRLVIAGGRLRDMIIRGGENIYPVEIENLLRQHPAVIEIAVFGLPDKYYGEIVAASVQLRENVPAGELREFCRGKIAGFKHPVRFFQVEQWPLTSSGKIKKRELQAAANASLLKELA
jgi:fatty-acyl-CoA synthase